MAVRWSGERALAAHRGVAPLPAAVVPDDVGAPGALDVDRLPGGRPDAVIGDHEALDRRTGLVRRRHVDPGGGGAGDLVLAPVAGPGEFVVLEERDPDRPVGDPVVGDRAVAVAGGDPVGGEV